MDILVEIGRMDFPYYKQKSDVEAPGLVVPYLALTIGKETLKLIRDACI
jgi:hypothetical protein